MPAKIAGETPALQLTTLLVVFRVTTVRAGLAKLSMLHKGRDFY